MLNARSLCLRGAMKQAGEITFLFFCQFLLLKLIGEFINPILNQRGP